MMFEDDVFRAEVPLLKNENSDDGAIKSDKGAINGEDGAIKSGKGAINGEDGAIKSDDGAINGEDGAIKSDDGAINGEDGAIKSDKGAIKNLIDREEAIYRFIADNGSATNAQICQLLNLKAPTVRKIFKKMVDKSILQPIGVNRSRKYILKK